MLRLEISKFLAGVPEELTILMADDLVDPKPVVCPAGGHVSRPTIQTDETVREARLSPKERHFSYEFQ